MGVGAVQFFTDITYMPPVFDNLVSYLPNSALENLGRTNSEMHALVRGSWWREERLGHWVPPLSVKRPADGLPSPTVRGILKQRAEATKLVRRKHAIYALPNCEKAKTALEAKRWHEAIFLAQPCPEAPKDPTDSCIILVAALRGAGRSDEAEPFTRRLALQGSLKRAAEADDAEAFTGAVREGGWVTTAIMLEVIAASLRSPMTVSACLPEAVVPFANALEASPSRWGI